MTGTGGFDKSLMRGTLLNMKGKKKLKFHTDI
jgi:hypothetical protein